MKRLKKILAIALALIATSIAAPSVGNAQGDDPRAKSFVDLYARTCLKHFGKPISLRDEMRVLRAKVLAGDLARPFLAGRGEAWSVAGAGGEFVVSASQGGVCAVYARRAAAFDVERRFAELLESLTKPPMAITKIDDKTADTPNGPTHFTSYRYAPPNAPRAVLMALTTTPSSTAELQAMATLSPVANK